MLRARNIIDVKTEDDFDRVVDSTPTLCLHTSIESFHYIVVRVLNVMLDDLII